MMPKLYSFPLLLLLCPFVCFLFSCKKNSFITSSGAIINFSSDTVSFDTVFTTTGSITQSVKIINGNNEKLMISSIRLIGGSNSVFKLNIDGVPGPAATGIEIDPNDSIYIFVSVYINQTSASLAFILEDSIQVSFNGNQQYIQLRAYGQNAHFLNNDQVSTNTTWPNDLPYVILGGLEIDSGAILAIAAGCRLFFHADAAMVINGTLLVQGTGTDRVYFMSDRLDYPYNGFPGSWPGIFFQESSTNNVLQSAVIGNATQGVVAENPSGNNNPKLSLNDCVINNIYDVGIWGIQSNITAQNCLVSNCGKNIAMDGGGNYSFTNCTVASYSNEYISHDTPVLNISNYLLSGGVANLQANFTNCIFWGSTGIVNSEVVAYDQPGATFTAVFQNCLWRMQSVPSIVSSSAMLVTDPLFDSINVQSMYYDFHLQAGSPAIGAGIATSFASDLDGNPRMVNGATDLGCYEFQ